MTKKRRLIHEIGEAAKARGIPFQQAARKGGNHEIWKLGDQTIPIPRHREIEEPTAQDIRKECEKQLGKDWWK